MWDPLKNWRKAGTARVELNYLLANASPQASLLERFDWLVELFRWMRVPGSLALPTVSHQTGQLQATRVRYLLMILEKNPEWKVKVARTLRSILRETSALDLFSVTGLPSESGFISEATDRFMERILPHPPHEEDLGAIFGAIFASEHDIKWLELLDAQVLGDIWTLFQHETEPADEFVWTKLRADMEDAVLFLAGQVRAFGLAPKLRVRMMNKGRLREMAFFEITFSARAVIRYAQQDDTVLTQQSMQAFREVLLRCRADLQKAYDHLDEFGVSIAIVYQLDRIEALLARIETLLEIILGKTQDPKHIVQFLCSLILEANERKSLSSFFGENLSLISMKIAERSAEAGDHYITRTRSEYRQMFAKAGQGGALTAFTALFKLVIESMKIPYFMTGLLSSLNYAGSFLGIYLVGATLATKQPAMTANALAAKMNSLEDQTARDSLVDEIVNLIRSQGAAILGNISFVIPCVILIEALLFLLRGEPLMAPEHALNLMDQHSALGLSPLHGAFTGVLLWFSSIVAGWVDNWSAYRELPAALASNRQLKSFLGPSRLKRWVALYQKHLAGWVGNIALGFMLGMTPKILGFIGLPLDVRHVTLSTGVVFYAAASLGLSVFSTAAFWWALIGIVLIGIMNLGVSFYLALLVALRARRIEASLRDEIYSEVIARFKRKPSSFFLAPQTSSKVGSH